ncbi:hypothetical protein [Chryseobacterium limigenitum]|uniref:Uncharacterized protein n=1 Tax=Chryseobacterium limigenitum TaxID=1612149 RepID=A0A1K2IDG2_9FLAO|nr:hypothetical protein [Chryseobacterium limigenitum]SFZ90423.1 hypothetical protein SAMN05216324_101354 [Chryseobacterium limigenitum]
MKKIVLLALINLSTLGFAQKIYTKISDSKINQERLQVAQNFINQYLDKCKNKDYTEFKDFIISKKIEKEVNEGREKACLGTENVKILGLNSVYIQNYSKDYDPVELFVYDISDEKYPTHKYISTWVYHDKNVIGGLWISEEKPIYKKKKKSE